MLYTWFFVAKKVNKSTKNHKPLVPRAPWETNPVDWSSWAVTKYSVKVF